MHWKDYLYFSPAEKIAVLILLVIIVLTFVLNVFLSNRSDVLISIPENDSLIAAFERLQESLEDKKIESNSYNYTPKDNIKKNSSSEGAPSSESNPTKKYLEKPQYIKQEKFTAPGSISLNETDTAEWKKVPGIGSVYSARIVKYGELLGGYISINQLKEVYGIDEELFTSIAFFVRDDSIDSVSCRKININELDFKEILAHPYIDYEQTKVIMNLRRQTGKIASLNQLAMLDEFTPEDIERITPYVEF